MKTRSTSAFSLVELTLALGIAAFCLIAVFGLVPVGVQTNRDATSETTATNILSSVVSDLRASPPNQSKSSMYAIPRNKGAKTTTCFDGQAKPTGTPVANDVVCTNSNSVYRLYVQIDNTIGQSVPPAHAYLRVTWPALANPRATPTIKPSGSVETVTAYFVN